MMYVPQAAWDKYKEIINGFHEDANQDTVIWRRYAPTTVALFNEQPTEQYTDISLKVLLSYNYFRTWPITKNTDTGELDNQNMAMYINVKYLTDLGYILPSGQFDYRPDQDYFMHRGIKYKAEGDTLVAQANNEPLLLQIVLRREELKTGELPFRQV